MRTIGKVLLAITVFTLVVSAHECGHWFGAWLVGIPITEFSVGFGPALWHTVIHGVQFSVRALPLGGFVMPDLAAVAQATPRMLFVMSVCGPLGGFAVTMLVALLFARHLFGQLWSAFSRNAAVVYLLAFGPVLDLVRAFRARGEPPGPKPTSVGQDGAPPKRKTSSGIMGPIGIMKGFATGNLAFILSVSAAINGLNLSPIPIVDGSRIMAYGLMVLGVSAPAAGLIPLFICGTALGYVLVKKFIG